MSMKRSVALRQQKTSTYNIICKKHQLSNPLGKHLKANQFFIQYFNIIQNLKVVVKYKFY